MPDWIRHAWWMIPLLAIVVYIPSFQADFTLDDVLIVEENTYVQSTDKIPDIWTSHYWAGKIDANDKGLYRPLTLTTYNLQYAISGENPMPFHVLNILLHALVCLVLMKTLYLLTGDLRMVFIAGLWYAVHPIHTEAVSGIVGRAEILAALFILTSMASYHHWRGKGSWVWLVLLLASTFAAIASKEHGFLVPVILVLQEVYYFFREKSFSWGSAKKWIGIGLSSCLAIGMWIFRSTITGPTVPHEQWLNVSGADRMATAVRTMAEYVGMQIWPLHLSADYWTDEVPIVGWGNPMVMLSLLLLLGLVAIAYRVRRTWPVISWGILFFFLTLGPVSNFLFPAGFLKAERILYIPSIGSLLVMAAVTLRGLDVSRTKTITLVAASLLTLMYAGRTWMRAGDWKNNYTLAQATLKTSPNSPRFNNMMGLELRDQKKNEEALRYFEKAVAANPNHVPALVNLGTEYRNMGKLPEAAATLEKALALEPNTLATYVNLMSVYRSMNRLDQNLEVARKAMDRFPQSAPVLWNAANAYQLTGDMGKADAIRAQARAIDPNIGSGK